MNDDTQNDSTMRSLAPVLGFALGALVGGGIARLLAPDSGERTRRRLGVAARRMTRDARHSIDEARETVTDAATGFGMDVKSAIEAGREAFQHDGDPREPRPVSRVSQIIHPPSTRTP